MTYFFILGNNPSLSIAEIVSKIEEKKIKIILPNTLIVETKKTITLDVLQNQLGGTIKIGQIITVLNIDALYKTEKLLVDKILSLLPTNVSKIFFGFSIYGQDKILLNLKQLALTVKKKIKERGISSRWVVSKDRALSSVIVQKNKLLTQGAEFVFFKHGAHIWFGKTITCQEFEQYSFYDYARPYRTIEKGMIPPKLAKIMINLSRADTKGILLDPFCGSGTVLQQALLMGYTCVIGTDIDQRAVENTKKNLQWLVKNERFKIKDEELNIKIQKCDVRKLEKKIAHQSVDTIVTEPYLGPLKIKKVNTEIKNLSDLYNNAFTSFKNILKPGGRVVSIFPVFKIKNTLHFLPILEQLKKRGWYIQSPLPDYLASSSLVTMTKRNSIIYSRLNQKVLREILIFTRSINSG